MDGKKLRKTSGRYFAWVALLICSSIIRLLPLQCLYGFAKILTGIGFLAVVRQRRIALKSLSIAFGREKSAQELNKIAKDCFAFLAKSGAEMLFFTRKPQLLKNRVIMQNKHILDSALSKGRGVILVSGHFGNFPLMMLKLRLESYSVGGILRHMRDQRAERMFAKLRDSFGLRTIYSQPRKACVDTTIKALRNNEIVCIQLDQNFGTAGVFVDFFGQKSATATGPVVFALRTKAELLPCFIIGEKDNTHRIIFEQEFDLSREDSFNKTVSVNIQRLTSIIESYIRRYPAQWGWMHRRWKTRPKENIAL